MVSIQHRRAVAQGLHRPDGADVAAITQRLLAVQAQDYRQAKLAVRARTAGLTAADVDAAMDDRTVVVSWFNRGTLHLVHRDDHAWLLGLTAPTHERPLLKRLGDFDVGADLADTLVDRIVTVLAQEGPLDRRTLAERLEAARRPGEGLSVVHALGLSGARGLTVRGPVVDGQQRYALTRDWLGTEPPAPLQGAERDRALAELARRYLRGHGPAADRDLAKWAGLPLRDARAGLTAIAGELVPTDGDLVALHGEAAEIEAAPSRLPARLLPMWDEMTVGYRDRALLLRAGDEHRFANRNGIVPAIVLHDGRAVGGWSFAREKGVTTATAEPWDDGGFGRSVGRAVTAECRDVTRFEG
ncbi:winged helix DNA-binding domain-containing protein [Conexibacter sp. W3-3-2]|uniref:winged helix DNA-binding domain-containing protein n=1 Tax=Conexibacter sp. W3-3-2 TaxID=2675227 RepID=UPI0012B93828|nr:winged helix DNA-binding domain-containing protein [Conexibacter sp. W3-3-2]MTD44444.1 winged helix DNA-binding domain-containing protein [Conexibacter sp. W3-3-2]